MLYNLSENINSGKQDKDYHSAIVVDNNDPQRIGRVRALVENRLEVSADQYSRLPWIMPDQGDSAAGRIDTATVRVPPLRSEIKVRFIDDNPFMGVYTGSFESTQHTNDSVFDNYPHTSGSVTEDGGWTRRDTDQGYHEMYRPEGSWFHVDQSGKLTVTLPDDIYIRSKGQIYVQSGDMNFQVAGFNVKATAVNMHADEMVNVRAVGPLNTDSLVHNDQMNLADTTPAITAGSAISSRNSQVDATIASYRKISEATTSRAANFNLEVYNSGVVGANNEPTIGSTTSYNKDVYDSGGGINILSLLRGGKIVASMLRGVPNLQGQAANLQAAVALNTALAGYSKRLNAYASTASTYPSTAVSDADAAVSALEALLDTLAATTGIDLATVINNEAAQIQTAVTAMDARILVVANMQAAHTGVPSILAKLRKTTATSDFGNDATLRDLIILAGTIQTVDVSVDLARLQAEQQSLHTATQAALDFAQVSAQVTQLGTGDADPDQLEVALAQLGSVSNRLS